MVLVLVVVFVLLLLRVLEHLAIHLVAVLLAPVPASLVFAQYRSGCPLRASDVVVAVVVVVAAAADVPRGLALVVNDVSLSHVSVGVGVGVGVGWMKTENEDVVVEMVTSIGISSMTRSLVLTADASY